VSISLRSRILIADDERLIADTLASILEHEGYEVAAVYGGRQAVEKARRWTPDLFLSDVCMPEVTGIQAALEIREMIPECRVLLFSGEPSSRELAHAARFRGQHFEFLDKPIPPMDLLSRIRRLRVA
jgi:CheY-like chemotaxis protein